MKKPKFELISPSAKYLLINKALTTIPFAKEAAEVMFGEKNVKSTRERINSIGPFLRLIHFEMRYRSVDNALSDIGIKNILEFSSGFSFRGLSMCKDPEVCYIDTDLPQIIDDKKIIVQDLRKKFCNYPIDNLYLRALNILDEKAFAEIISLFPAGPIAIVNEGLLSYLDELQKRKLCEIIHNLLSIRGGYWITADIYRKTNKEDPIIEDFFDDYVKSFLEIHHVEENRFESFELWEAFFKNCGFDICKKIEASRSQISSIKFLARFSRNKLEDLKRINMPRQTWILKIT
ncbi:MAG: hypothetical protein ACFFAT_20045 [Promethearchaeota archaeon]